MIVPCGSCPRRGGRTSVAPRRRRPRRTANASLVTLVVRPYRRSTGPGCSSAVAADDKSLAHGPSRAGRPTVIGHDDAFHPNLRHIPAGDLTKTPRRHRHAPLRGISKRVGRLRTTVMARRTCARACARAIITTARPRPHLRAHGTPEFVFLDEVTGDESDCMPRRETMCSCRRTRRTARRTMTRTSRPVVVIARSTQEAIVVNLPSLRAQA